MPTERLIISQTSLKCHKICTKDTRMVTVGLVTVKAEVHSHSCMKIQEEGGAKDADQNMGTHQINMEIL